MPLVRLAVLFMAFMAAMWVLVTACEMVVDMVLTGQCVTLSGEGESGSTPS